MGLSTGFVTSQKNDPSGGMPAPPFDPTSAVNGLSVDTVTGKIVLGNDVGSVLAALFSNREIPIDGFKINFITQPGETIGIDASNGVFPTVYNILDRNIQATGMFSRSTNPGVQAGIFNSVFNEVGSNVTYGVMSSNYAVANSYEPDSPFVQANNGTVNATLSFLSQAGFIWAPHGNNSRLQAAMKMFQTGNLVLDTIGVNPFVDTGSMLQVRSKTELGGNQASGTLIVRAEDTNILFKNQTGASTVGSIGRGSSGGIGISAFLAEITLDPAAGSDVIQSRGLFRFAGTTGNTLRWGATTAVPSLTAGPAFTSFYGGNTNALGDPTAWLLVNVAGTDRKIPCF